MRRSSQLLQLLLSLHPQVDFLIHPLLLKLRPEIKDEKILTAAAAASLSSPTGLTLLFILFS
jgi:hypothetical protein